MSQDRMVCLFLYCLSFDVDFSSIQWLFVLRFVDIQQHLLFPLCAMGFHIHVSSEITVQNCI